MGKMTVELDENKAGHALYERVASRAGVEDDVARSVLRGLLSLGYTIAEPRVQWR